MQQQRIANLRTVMSSRNIDAVWIVSPENRYYFSGFRGSAGNLLLTLDQCFLFTDFRYTEQAAAQAPLFEIVQHKQNMLPLLCEYIKKLSGARIGFEQEKATAGEYLEFRRALPAAELVSFDQAIDELRMIKDETEIECIRQGEAICDQAFSHILKFIRPGVSELDIGLELEFFMRRAGAEGIKANHVIASGERSALPHGQATSRTLKAGDFVTMDYGARVNGYYSDFTRTVVIGQPSVEQRDIYRIVKEAQAAALAAIGPGKVCAEMDEVARSIIRQAGFGDCFGHSLGHSIGLAVHEKPVMRSTDKSVLKPGVVISVEPGIYVPGFGGVRIEDLIVITADGFVNLTGATKELIVL